MSGPKKYRPWQPRQSFLLPPSPLDWLESDHLAYFILDLVDELDLSGIESAIQSKDGRGTRPYSPRMMTALLLYAYSVGVYSSRKIERATREHVAFRVLSGGAHPYFTTIHEFRTVHAEALSSLFDQILELCQKAGLVKLTHVAVDGTKVQASASKHKAMSYARMVEEETAIQKQVREWFRRADEEDAREDAEYGVGKREHDLPEELRRREDRLRLIRKWRKELEEEAKASRAAELQDQAARARERAQTEPRQKVRRANRSRAARCDEQAKEMSSVSREEFFTSTGLPKHRIRALPDGTPHPHAQWNFVDSESRILEHGGTFVQGYNCQLAVDSENQIIVAQAVTNQSPDNGNLLPMLEQVEANCEESPAVVTADAGYWSARSLPPARRVEPTCTSLRTASGVETRAGSTTAVGRPRWPCARSYKPRWAVRSTLAARRSSSRSTVRSRKRGDFVASWCGDCSKPAISGLSSPPPTTCSSSSLRQETPYPQSERRAELTRHPTEPRKPPRTARTPISSRQCALCGTGS